MSLVLDETNLNGLLQASYYLVHPSMAKFDVLPVTSRAGDSTNVNRVIAARIIRCIDTSGEVTQALYNFLYSPEPGERDLNRVIRYLEGYVDSEYSNEQAILLKNILPDFMYDCRSRLENHERSYLTVELVSQLTGQSRRTVSRQWMPRVRHLRVVLDNLRCHCDARLIGLIGTAIARPLPKSLGETVMLAV